MALAALLAALLPFAPNAGGRVSGPADDGRPGPVGPGRSLDAFDRLLLSAARQTAAHEKARERADRLRDEVTRLRTRAKEAQDPEEESPGRGAGTGTGGDEEAANPASSTSAYSAASDPSAADADPRAARAALDEAVTELRAAERRRADIRRKLWRSLEAAQPGMAGPTADCALGRLSGKPLSAPSRWRTPTSDYRLSAGYAAEGGHWRHRHTGQDFAVPTGTAVYAVGPGTVAFATCGDGFGNQVVIRHRDGYFTQYAHLSRINVRPGQKVVAGQRVGASGATGNATGPHLHFEVRVTPYLGSAVPPLTWLRRHGVRM